MKNSRLEYGYDFITLYFESGNDCVKYAQKLYKELTRIKSNLLELNRKDFAHQPEDPAHFHTDGCPKDMYEDYHHFHVVFPNRPKKTDWEYLMKTINEDRLGISFNTSVPIREVK